MSDAFHISDVMPTGEKSTQFGDEYHVKFAESAETFKLWYKKEPKAGMTQWGDINGTKFKKDGGLKDDDAAPAAPPQGVRRSYDSVEKDKSDGARQGMCMNNAANYVNSQSDDKLSPAKWADAVYKYATALYRQGDLTMVDDGKNDVPSTVEEVFGVK